MEASEILGKIALTILIIAAAVALFMIAFSDWQIIVLKTYIGVFYFFGFFFVFFIVLAIIAAVWDH